MDCQVRDETSGVISAFYLTQRGNKRDISQYSGCKGLDSNLALQNSNQISCILDIVLVDRYQSFGGN
jgi:hypothetical protein